MEIKKVRKDGFCVVGLKVQTMNSKEANPDTAIIPGLWQQFFSESIEAQISNKTDNESIFGVYWDYADGSEKTYSLLAGRETVNANVEGFVTELTGLEIPESVYLVFSDEGEMPNIIYSMWESIRDYFAENDEFKRQYTYDFECYSSENSNRVDIYIAIEP